MRADPFTERLGKIKGYTTVGYDPWTGQTYPLTGYERFGRLMYWGGDSIWYFEQWRPGDPYNVLDWGDLGTPGTGFTIGGIYVIVLGNQVTPTPGINLAITWLAEENGYNSTGRIPWARLNLVNLPGLPPAPPGWGSGWEFAIDFQVMNWIWTLDGNDLDGDGLIDFGYSYWFYDVPPETTVLGTKVGPYHSIAGENGGAEDVFDLYGDPNYQDYYESYWGGGPFRQFWQKLYGVDCPSAGATPPGVLDYCWTDIYPAGPGGPLGSGGDCLVNISDLATLLPNYNQPGTFTFFDGDVYPKYFGDGTVNISDLGLMLAQYGDNCN